MPAGVAPPWLDLASAFPVAPVALAMEAAFNPATHSWPMPATGLLVVLGWSAAATAVIIHELPPLIVEAPGMARATRCQVALTYISLILAGVIRTYGGRSTVRPAAGLTV